MSESGVAAAIDDAEVIVIGNDVLTAWIVPDMGARIWRLRVNAHSRDLLWNSRTLRPAITPAGSSYDDSFVGGWDELFPNDIPEELGGLTFPDHGELWSARWAVAARSRDGSSAEFATRGPISGVQVTKRVRLPAGRPAVVVEWRVDHRGDRELPVMWKQHLALPVAEGARILLPESTVTIADFGRPRLPVGTSYSWPDGSGVDMSEMPRLDGRVSEFQCATGLREGWCGVTYADGLALRLRFDPEIFPAVWTFASYGEWQGEEVLVLEPSTGWSERAGDGPGLGTHRLLKPGDGLTASMVLEVDSPIRT